MTCSAPGALAVLRDLGAVTPSAVGGDSQGNLYVAGSFKGTATIGATMLTATGAVDFFLAKLAPSGAVVYAQHFGAAKEYQGPSPAMVVTPAGDVFMAGQFAGTVSFGGTSAPVVAVGADAFAVHFAPSGAATWADHFGYNGSGYWIGSVALDPSGDVVVGGTANGPIVLGTRTWSSPDPSYSQAFAARLSAASGSVVWSAASGGTLNFGTVWVAVDAQHRTFLTGECLGGSSEWGIEPLEDVGNFCTFRVGLDATGHPLWSQFDFGGLPFATSVDSAGRVAVVEDTDDSVNVAGTSFSGSGWAAVSLLFNPADGTLLSGGVGTPAIPNGSAADDGNDFTFVAGQYSTAATFGTTTLPGVGAWGSRSNLFVAQADATSHFVWATGIGAGQTQVLGTGTTATGSFAVAATTDTAFTTAAGSVDAGDSFVALFTPATCGVDPGPSVPPGDGLPGDLLDAAPPGSDAAPGTCPSAQSGAVNGAACPVAMACLYTTTTCCSCEPTACGAKATTWTCVDMGTQPAACPTTPPTAGVDCTAGLDCTYCLPAGRYYASCTAGGWSTGYAQVICQ